MAAASPKISIDSACDPSLRFIYWFNHESSLAKQLIESPARDGIAASVDHSSSLHVGRCGNAPGLSIADGFGVDSGIGFIPKNRNKSGTVNNHFGRPLSS